MIKYQLYFHLTTSTWPKKNFKKTCHNLVKILFLLSNTKYMYFAPKTENTKVQALAPIISITHYATKESPINSLHNATRTLVVTLLQRDLFTVE